VGGGNIGGYLARILEADYAVKIIDRNPQHTANLSRTLNRAVVLQGDTTDKAMLLEEGIDRADVYCVVTNDDEANILSAMQAKRLGVRRVMALINRTAYVDLIEGSDIDVAISPQQATIGSILTHIRRGDIINVYSLRRGAAEAIEIVAHGDRSNSRVVGRTVAELTLPAQTTIGAIARADKILIGDKRAVIQSGDHVILFIVDKRQLPEIERLFQVGVTYF